MTGRRGLAVAVLGGLATGGLALLGLSRPWARAEIVAAGVPQTVIETAGTDVLPWAGALTLVVVTGSLALIPTSGRFRRGLGALIAIAAAGTVVGTVAAGPAIDDAVSSDIAASPAAGGVDDEAVATDSDRPAWRWLSLGGSAGALVVGVAAIGRGHRWPTMGSRYDPPRPRRHGDRADPDADLWRAMDEGSDPTA